MKELSHMIQTRICEKQGDTISMEAEWASVRIWIKNEKRKLTFHIKKLQEGKSLFGVECVGYKNNATEQRFSLFTRKDSKAEKDVILAYYQEIKGAIKECIEKDPKLRFQVLLGKYELIKENFVLRDIQGKLVGNVERTL